MINQVSIIVLTPVKNEDWILDKFLRITSLFADHILVADQGSTDNTKQIIGQYPKAIYIENEKEEYDENYRQNLLINKARELFRGKKLLIALDADEIITADSIDSLEWSTICSQPEGTQILFKKPDVLPGLTKFLNHPDYFLLGYIDDGRTHIGLKFHSPRLPSSNQQYFSTTIAFMHLAIARNLEYDAKQRLYSVLENLNKTSSLRFRYRKYAKTLQEQLYQSSVRALPESWLKAYEKIGIYLKEFSTSEVNNYNIRILKEFNDYGTYRFWMDDIWYVDFNEINKSLNGVCKKRITYPPFFVNNLREALIFFYGHGLKLKSSLAKK